ncbi:disease resistance protein RGH5 [Striga asiatica]|uniref:Disease resistance protein RGH5 n=1 Tax=Striga asiatica TaxID=4170 RepID=A0A5A7Q697_STRAF|nr:disease resistance protein RGH5 [Striga asiatica]
MTAYGALLSLTNTIDQIQNHPRPPISLDKLKIKPLIQMVAFLMQFLENYIIDDADGLEGRMIDAAHEVEDIIESYIVDHIEPRGKANINSNDKDDSLYGELQKVMSDFDSITKDVAAVKDKAGKKIAPSSTEDDAMLGSDDVMNNIMKKLNKSPYSEGDGTMVGSDYVMNDIMDKLTSRQSSRWIIAIAGMGGIGKTTLAKKIYENQLIVEYFDIRGWGTISQEFDSKRILLEVLHFLKITGGEESEHELGDMLYKSLFGRRYLIVMDDIWGTDAWDRVKPFFPNNNNGSKVLITTRPSKLAMQLDGPDYFQMPFLKVDESWNLLSRFVFHEQGCPPELEEIGKEIAKKCRGLPLSIVVIGGLLAKSEQTRQSWQHVSENLSSTVKLKEDERCFRILKLSYNELPVHLKPCFLYMGMFPEDDWIHVPMLIRLWVDEGFVKPVAGKSLEKVARVLYLNDLILRNLIMVRAWGPTRRLKRCGIHDLLRDLCIKEAEKYKLFRTMGITTHNHDHEQSWRAQHRIGIHHALSEGEYIPRPLPEAVQSASRARTLIWRVNGSLPSIVPFRLLRILNGYDRFLLGYNQTGELPLGELFHPINLCHLLIVVNMPKIEFPPEFYLLWNLQTLIFCKSSSYDNRPVLDIWRMPQLRHVKLARLQLTDSPPPPPMEVFENGWMVLEKLETLKTVFNLRLSEKVVERIPNIKKLGIVYNEEMELAMADYSLENLCRLRKLEDLSCIIDLYGSELARDSLMITFPVSLRKLHLQSTRLGWEDMGTKIGSLPYLEELQIRYDAFVGPEWETAEGGFPSLKYLEILWCSDLEQWRLVCLVKLKEIPLGIGDIPTLREIHVQCCSDSTVLSAKKILEEQQECLGEVELQITV